MDNIPIAKGLSLVGFGFCLGVACLALYYMHTIG